MAGDARGCAASLGLALILSIAAACSSKPGRSSDGGPLGGSNGGASGLGGVGGVGGGRPPRPFWCPRYRSSDAAPSGWVEISAKVARRGTGPMTSPINSCTVPAGSARGDWSVVALGKESDGVDETAMSFKVTGVYEGPGWYAAAPADGIFASFAHGDVQSLAFGSVPTSDCELCINDDGLSGTVSCWGLETPAGSSYEVGYIEHGSFTCPNAQAKPADAPTDPAPRASSAATSSATTWRA